MVFFFAHAVSLRSQLRGRGLTGRRAVARWWEADWESWGSGPRRRLGCIPGACPKLVLAPSKKTNPLQDRTHQHATACRPEAALAEPVSEANSA